MKVQIVDRIISVHKNANERLSKINPYILIGASITGTLLILHIHKLWKNSKLRFSEYCLSWFRRLPPPLLPPPVEQQQRQNAAPKRDVLIRPIQHAQSISELPPTNGTGAGGAEEAASIAGTGRIGTLSVLSDDSFISACDEFIPTNEDRDISVSTDFSVLALYNEGLKAAERGEVVYRKSRAEICGCDSEQDFVAKLYCIRLAFRRIMDDAQTMQKLMRTGRAIMADLLRHDKRDPADFYAAYDSMIAYLNDERNLETTKEELRSRKVESTNLWDVLFDLIILDAFEDLQRPPSSISALIRNSFMSQSMKESTLNNIIWSMIRMKRTRLQFKDGFISHFYDISQILTSSLAMGLFGGSTREYQELCIYFKEQIFGFILEIYNPNRVRFTTVAELAEDIAKLMLERVELLQVKLSNELLPI